MVEMPPDAVIHRTSRFVHYKHGACVTCFNPSNFYFGRAIAQAVSRWLPTAPTQVQRLSGNLGFVVDKVVLGQVFSEYFGFPCQS
jgi:hypothetical protein